MIISSQESLDELLRGGSSPPERLDIHYQHQNIEFREEHSTAIASFPLEKLGLNFPEACWQANSKKILFTQVLQSNTIKRLDLMCICPIYSFKWFVFKTPISRTLEVLYLQQIRLSRDDLVLLKGGLKVNIELHTLGFQRCKVPDSRSLSTLILGFGESRLRKFWFNYQPLNSVGLFCYALAVERRSQTKVTKLIEVHACIENTRTEDEALILAVMKHFFGLLGRSKDVSSSWTNGFFGETRFSESTREFMKEHFSHVFSRHGIN